MASLLENGIKTYVVGTPGSSPYAALLDQLALAGGTARSGSTSYYDVKHVSELDDVLAAIGATVILGCHLRLEAPPPDPALVNIYLRSRAFDVRFDRRMELDGGVAAGAGGGAGAVKTRARASKTSTLRQLRQATRTRESKTTPTR